MLLAVLLFALWIALTDNTRPLELVVGAACALVAGLLATRAARAGGVAIRPRARWLARAAAVPWQVVRDTVQVLAAIGLALVGARPLDGRLRAVPFDPGGPDAAGQARRAIAFGLGSAGPNQYVVADSAPDATLVVHELRPTDDVAALDLVEDR